MGGSSSQVVGYRYYAKFAAFIGNRIEKFIGINFDNRGWIADERISYGSNGEMIYIEKLSLFGENEGGVAGTMRVKYGTNTQTPSTLYQQHMNSNNLPASAYPYQSYIVFGGGGFPQGAYGKTPEELEVIGDDLELNDKYYNGGFYLGNSGYMKEMLLWVKRIHVKNNGDVQWYDIRAEVPEGGGVDEVDEPPFDPDMEPLEITGEYTMSRLLEVDGEVIGDVSYPEIGDIAGKTLRFWGGGWSTSEIEQYPPSSFSSKVYLGLAHWVGDIRVKSYLGGSVNITGATFRDYDDAGFAIYDIDFVGGALSIDISVPSTMSIQWSFLNLQKFPVPHPVVDSGDMNPIHKIREILTDDAAMGKPETDVNDTNFMKAADRIYDEGLGVSWAIDEKSCIEAIEELCYHIEAGIRVNRQTGLYEMVLFRDDWFAEDEIHAITENRIKDLSLEVMNSDDIVNQLNVTYYDRERIKNSTFSVYENGSILTMGHANAESVEFPYFMNMRNAEIVANWKLKQFSTPAWSGSFTTGCREARKWNRYDLIRLPWSKKWNGTILVRIMKINLGNGTDNTVTIDFEEVIPYSGEMNTSIVVDTPVDAGPQPPQPSINAVFEAPYYLTVLRAGQTNVDLELSNNPDIGYVAAIAAKPQNNSLNALLYTDGGVGEFEQVSRLDYCDILQLDQPINETASAFIVTGSLTQTANSNNLILLNGELMGFVVFDDATKVLTVKRGVLDTVPKKHSSGSLFVFDLPDVAFDSTQYAQSEIVEAQVLTTTPSGIQGLSGTGTPIEIQSRAIRPYPPANVKINNVFMPSYFEDDFTLTWSDRNRLQQTGGQILGYFEGSVALESNTQTLLTVIELDANNVELATHSVNVTASNSFTLIKSAMQVDTRSLHVNLKTVRDGYECLYAFNHTVIRSALVAPTNVTFEVIEY